MTPLLVLVVALAAGALRTELDFRGEPHLAVRGDGVVRIEVMEAATTSRGAPAAAGPCLPRCLQRASSPLWHAAPA